MDQFWWYLTRATGLVATALAVASLVWGLFFSARNTGTMRSPAWWLDLHNYLGGLALVFTGAHVIASLVDPNGTIGIVDAVVPGTAGWAVTWGVLATYIFVVTVFTSWPKRRFSRPVWRIVHLTSVAGVAFAGVHGLQLGSDAENVLFEAGLIVCAAAFVYAVSLRVLGVLARSRAR
jgi:predicted ferric reductase